MGLPLITICTVNYNSAKFVLNTLYCLERITKNDYKVIIRDNNSKFKDYKILKKNSQNFTNVFLYRIENFNYTGSIAHGIAVNDLINRIDTKYGVILDADCTFLLKNWDELLIKELDAEHPIIGTPATYNTGPKRTSDFPLMYGILFDSAVMKEINVDFRPDKKGQKVMDTGYKIRDKLIEHGYKSKIFEGRSTRINKSGPFRRFICAEYYLNGHNSVFGSHFGRGSSLGKGKFLSKNKKIKYLLPIIGNFLLKQRGKRERKNWIKLCMEIVRSQQTI